MGQDGSRRAGSMVVIHQAAVLETERAPQQQSRAAEVRSDDDEAMEWSSQVRTKQRRVV